VIDAQQMSDWAARLLISNPFPGKSQRELVEIIKSCRIQRYSDGQTILNEGDPGEEMFFLMEGSVAVLKADINGAQRPLIVMEAPTMFGHMAMVDGSPRSATCKAEGNVVVAALTRHTYQELLSRPHPVGTTLRRLMLSTLTRQLVDGNARLFSLIGGESPEPGEQKQVTRTRPTPTPKKKSSQVRQDVSRDDLLDMAGILNGWKVDTVGLEDIEFVETEDDRRRSGKPSD